MKIKRELAAALSNRVLAGSGEQEEGVGYLDKYIYTSHNPAAGPHSIMVATMKGQTGFPLQGLQTVREKVIEDVFLGE